MSETDPPAIEPVPDDDEHDGFSFRRLNVDQLALFPTEEINIPSKILSFKKSISAIHAIPTSAERNHTLNTRRLFDALILVAQLDYRKRSADQIERIRSERISPMFEVRVTDLARLAGIPGKNYQRLYEDLDHLFEMSFKWNVVGEDSQVEWETKSRFLSSYGKGVGARRGQLRFSMEPSILEIILEPKLWARLSLDAVHSLKTASSLALLEATWRYVNTDKKVTASLPTETWIQLIMGVSRYVKTDSKGNTTTHNYADFKRRVLVPSIERINEVPALGYTLALKEEFSGNRVSKLQFKFIAKNQASLGLPMTWPDEIIKMLQQLGFNDQEIATLSESHSLAEVADSIFRLKQSQVKLHKLGQRITATKPYFIGILTNVSKGASGEEIEIDPVKIEAEAKAVEAQRVAELREQRAKEGFMQHQQTAFATRLFELPDAQRLALFEMFEQSPLAAQTKILLEKKGWSRANTGALSILRSWMAETKSPLLDELLCNPEDKSLDAWLAWRLDTLSGSGH